MCYLKIIEHANLNKHWVCNNLIEIISTHLLTVLTIRCIVIVSVEQM